MNALLKGALETVRGFYPFIVCLVGAAFVSISWEQEGVAYWIVSFLGAACFVWAIDLAEEKGRAKAAAQYAGVFLEFALSAEDKEIIITHRHETGGDK